MGLAAGRSRADIAPGPASYELDALFAKSDAVCLARAQQEAETQTGTEGYVKEVSRTAGLLPRRCYKGEISPGDSVSYITHVPGVHATDTSLPEDHDALLFLKRSGERSFSLAFPFFGHLSDASLPVLDPETASGLEQLQRDVVASTKALVDPRLLLGNFRVLHGFRALTPDALNLLRAYSAGVDAELAMGAYEALAKFGDPADLFALCQFVSAPGGEPAASATVHYNFVSVGQIRNPAARAALECLARAPRLALYAIDAIRGIASKESVPELVKHLDDSDINTQYMAVITLWEIVRRPGEVGPSVPMFEQDPMRFIQSWKRWWAETGQALYPEAPGK